MDFPTSSKDDTSESALMWFLRSPNYSADEKRRMVALEASVSVHEDVAQVLPMAELIELFLIGAKTVYVKDGGVPKVTSCLAYGTQVIN